MDLTSGLPETTALARCRGAPHRRPELPQLPAQDTGVRRSRALPYTLRVDATALTDARALQLDFINDGRTGACFHVYDRLHLDRAPRRYSVEAGLRLNGLWSLDGDASAYDLWVLGPNGFHRRFIGSMPVTAGQRAARPEISVTTERAETSSSRC